jgi:hypothetical protein
MAFYAAQLKDKIHANRARKAKATAAISQLGLEELWEVEGALQVTYTLARMAERYKMTYRELSVALMESLFEEWKASHGKLKRCRFLQTTPVHRADLDKRGPTTWSRLSDKQTQIYPEDLEHESEIVTKLAGDDATSEALNDSFGIFCNIIHDESASEQEENPKSSSQDDTQARTLFPS